MYETNNTNSTYSYMMKNETESGFLDEEMCLLRRVHNPSISEIVSKHKNKN